MKKTALQICLTVSLVIFAATVSAQAQNSLNTNTQRAVSCNDHCVVAMDAGKVDDAIQLFKEATRLRPDYAIAYGNLARLSTTKGSLKKQLQF